jgi:MoxR-like ATPase
LLASEWSCAKEVIDGPIANAWAPQRSVVLIDEVDKAPRDFPNDLLGEIERLSFTIPEMRNLRIEASDAYRPVVVLTSNMERQLPDAFLRRCVYHHISPPSSDLLYQIAQRRLGSDFFHGDRQLVALIELFIRLRDGPGRWEKRPGTAELLAWLEFLSRNSQEFSRLDNHLVVRSLCVLAKVPSDLARASEIVKTWVPKTT